MENTKTKVTRKEIIEAAKEAARNAGGTITKAEFYRRTGIPDTQIYTLFHGGWLEILKLAGLKPSLHYQEPVPDKRLMTELHNAVTSLKRIPSWYMLARKTNLSVALFKKRFCSKEGILKAYLDWLSKNHPDSPFIDTVKAEMNDRRLRSRSRKTRSRKSPQRIWKIGKGTEYGELLDFRSMLHAPTNERAVIFLFGMLCWELGFLIETIRPDYPDCIGKRRVDRHPGEEHWQGVRIEFEFRSSNFKNHHHNPADCDVIVCWEHDWQDCPLEVIELRQVIEQLPLPPRE